MCRLLLATLPQVFLVFLQTAGDHIGQFALQSLQQQRLALLPTEAADLVQLLRLHFDKLLHFLRAFFDLGLPLRQLAPGYVPTARSFFVNA